MAFSASSNSFAFRAHSSAQACCSSGTTRSYSSAGGSSFEVSSPFHAHHSHHFYASSTDFFHASSLSCVSTPLSASAFDIKYRSSCASCLVSPYLSILPYPRFSGS